MVIRQQGYYKCVIIKAMWHWLTDNKMDKLMFMTEGVSQSREERRNCPMNSAKTLDYPYQKIVFLLHTHIHTINTGSLNMKAKTIQLL